MGLLDSLNPQWGDFSGGFDPTAASAGLGLLANMFQRPKYSTNIADVTGPDNTGFQNTIQAGLLMQRARQQKLAEAQAKQQMEMNQAKLDEMRRQQEALSSFRSAWQQAQAGGTPSYEKNGLPALPDTPGGAMVSQPQFKNPWDSPQVQATAAAAYPELMVQNSLAQQNKVLPEAAVQQQLDIAAKKLALEDQYSPSQRPKSEAVVQQQLDIAAKKLALEDQYSPSQRPKSEAVLQQEIALKQAAPPGFSVHPVGQNPYGEPIYGLVNNKSGAVTPLNIGQSVQASDASGSPSSNLTGADYLATMEPERAAQMKAIVEGRMSPPGAFALKTPYWQRMMSDIGQYEPGFDLTKWTQRNQTRKEFSAGGPNSPAGNITSGNTAIQHLGALSDAAEALDNGSFPTLNSVRNFAREQTGDPRVVSFDSIRNKYVEEATKFYRGVGGAEADIKRDIAALNAAQSPAQLREAIAQNAELMQSKINALQDRWKQGMGPNAGEFPIIQDKSAEQLAKIRARAKGEEAPKAKEQKASEEDIQATMKATMLPRAEVIKRLKAKGFSIEGQ